MSHDPHHTLPGYSPNQILIDGCAECEARSARPDHGLDHLDMTSFAHAWARAAAWNSATPVYVCPTEAPLLRVLWSVQVQLERRGVPIGHIPSGELIIASTAPKPGACAEHMVIDCPDCACRQTDACCCARCMSPAER